MVGEGSGIVDGSAVPMQSSMQLILWQSASIAAIIPSVAWGRGVSSAEFSESLLPVCRPLSL